MDGLFFYWIMWMVWVCVMFFVPKAVPFRFALLFHLLAVLLLTRYHLTVYTFTVQLSGLYMFIVLCIAIRRLYLWKTIEIIISCFIMALAYASFHLFVLLDPIWVIIKPIYLQGIFLNYLVLLVIKEWELRIAVLVLGMLFGDCLFAGLLQYQSLPYAALSFAWHDGVAFVLVIQLAWVCLEYITTWLYTHSQNRFLLKEKQG
ncbi:YphA family membrane protein [Peribacillus asahii]|uniref:Uncharacterized protein n=1 Tax=Peribacillus asahii TaxID=228899 RepID=A0A3T0KUQ5_9BACI|nr:hypothetical protein [Peribacillus asahii]AZV44152.1 hypothetical protein BAOM_3543 [Peribacillus asahii]USK83870.1 hypothetical protein LIT35_15670 [Peribacillus asahii]